MLHLRRHDLLYLLLAEGGVLHLIYLQPIAVSDPKVVAEAVYLDLRSGTCA